MLTLAARDRVVLFMGFSLSGPDTAGGFPPGGRPGERCRIDSLHHLAEN